MNIADELQKLQQLRQSGGISEEEYDRAKEKILNGQPAAAPFGANFLGGDAETQTRQWGMILHLSMFAGYILPFAGFIAPILVWQLKKTDLPGIDPHGKNAVNWLISALIYSVVGTILLPIFGLGLLILLALAVLGVVFPIVAALKANNGEVWKYPGAISFFK
jgi:uncharacterized Tic20 family protein